ncbi:MULTISPECIES: MFS transporter [Pandoraea]|uniref:MFS transporter n=1 Tax=Pandoraea TaxID=93217 RepID=UPI001F5D0CEC|nr:MULTISPECIES: MFS transporter [Pandoraea]MCI3206402.1 MFS transporter [Pandoraea sp. LA3]MDN4584430.1 MFS transporter [Pandoraea capi]
MTPLHLTYRKILWRIIPFIFLCYVINYLERVNIGFAKLQFLHDLHLDETVFGIAAAVFFIGYVLFEVPSNLLLTRIGAPATLFRIMLLWGIFTAGMAFTMHEYWLYTLRFLIGAAEAGFFPGVVLYLSYWLPDRYRGRAMTTFMIAIPFSGIFGGPLSGWIMQSFDGLHGLRGWQWLFLCEAPPAIVAAVLALFVLPRSPEHARWLSDDEKRAVAKDLAQDRAQRSQSSATVGEVLRDPRIYLLALIYFTVTSFNTNQVWLPTLLRNVSHASLGQIGWISGAMSVGATLGIFLVGQSSDRLQERRWHIIGCGALSAAAYLLIALTRHSTALTAVLLSLGTIGGYGVLSLFWTIPPAWLDRRIAPLGIGLISALGQFGGAAGPLIVARANAVTGNLYGGFATVGLMLLGGVICFMVFVPRTRKPDAAPHVDARPSLTASP